LIEHFRNLLVAKITPKDTSKSGLIELSKEQLDLIIKQAAPFSIQDIFYIINVLIGTNELIRKHQYAKIILEVAMVKLTQREDLSTLREILDNLSRIEISKGEPAREIPPTQQASIPQSRQTKTSAPVKTEPPQQDDSKNRAKLETIRSHWGQLMQTLEKEKMSVATFMLEAKPVMVNNGSLVVGLPEQFTLHRESLEAPENRKLIEDILAKLIGQSVKLEFTGYKKEEAESNLDVEVPQEEEMPQVEEVDLSNEEVSSEEINEKKEQVDDSLVNLALKIFNGKVVKKDNDTKQ